ncbi:MAG: SIS domain-containing protein [Erysipelotrichaceae bacterium]|jgi:D-sedoheptulose 7-phosphate isomerase|nr:SIS domain-containing protein [Erysipelotrichaceae bacterium]MCH4044075.1 SIS domain-containing protein [Erysipelotrichaceae bacterium]MCH4121290.1 SIS domain-containing protein [Erysipelotrichaceae bacterium]
MNELIKERLKESIQVKEKILSDDMLISQIAELGEKIAEAISSGHKLVLCGNGGSASDALHFAGEIVGRFQKERDPWPAVVLNADVTTMTAIANDYSYDDVFARQASAHVNTGDVFIGISTSGNSENVLRAAKVSQEKGAYTAALLGKTGGKIGKIVDCPIIVPSNVTARIQESHICIIHILCEITEDKLSK